MLPLEYSVLVAFILTAAAIVLSPGPDTMLILRHSLVSGRQVGIAAVLGVQVGLLCHALLAILGISLIIAQNETLFKTVALAGAIYLAWLGIQSFRSIGPGGLKTSCAAIGPLKAMRQGIVCNLLNPKVIVLFLALFPNFIDYNRDDVTAQVVTMTIVLILLNLAWQAPIALAADRLKVVLADEHRIHRLSQITGIILLVFAALMVADHLF